MAFLPSFTFPKKHIRPALAVAALALALIGSYFRIFELYELQTYDWRCQIRGPRPVSKDIVLIDIADDTLKQIGAWPFDRINHAVLIQTLSQYGAKAIVFDILFSEPWEKPESDAYVAQAAREAGNVYFARSFSGLEQKSGMWSAANIGSDLISGYAESAKGVGHVNAWPDIDGKRRRTIATITYAGKAYYQMVFRVAADILGSGAETIKVKPGKYIQLGPDIRVPLDDQGCFIISYAGIWEKTFQHYSYVDIIYSAMQISEGEKPRLDLVSKDTLKGKICVIGHAAHGTVDTNPIPIQSVYPMVGQYANIFNDILLKDYIYRAHRLWNIAALVFFGFLIGWISMKHRPITALWYTLAAISLFSCIVVGLFFLAGLWIDFFYPMVVFIVLYACVTLSRVLFEMRKRELIENELKIASQIQKSFLPASMPDVKGLSIAVFFQPAKAVGGDLYAFVKLPSEKMLGVMGGDVSGKGTPAALFMAKTVSEFKFSARDRLDPAQALEQVNNAISSEATGGLFVTMAYAIFDIGEKKLLLSNGGHLPVAAVAADGKSELLTAGDGMPIGVMEGAQFGTIQRDLNSGDIFAFYSDGVSEARNRKKEEYSVERLQTCLSQFRALAVNDIVDKTAEDLKNFMGKADQHDDITLIVVKIDQIS